MIRFLALASLLSAALPALAQPLGETRPEVVEEGAGPGLAALGPEAWREDLGFLAERIRSVHPNPFRFTSAEAFESEVARLGTEIPELGPAGVLAGMLRAIALTTDGHTRIQLGFPGLGGGAERILGFRRLPVRLYAFPDGLTVVAATPEWRRLLGARVTAIGGTDVEEVLARAKSYVPADNEEAALDRLPRLLEIPEIVAAMGLSASPDSVAITIDREGQAEDLTLPAVPPPGTWVSARPTEPMPLYATRPNEPYWAEWLPDGTLYVQYNQVVDAEGESIEGFFERLFGEAETRGTQRMILDMRFNTGGNNALNWPIVYGLIRSDMLNRRGALFVLIGRHTFSAAQNGVNELERHTEVVFVGEPSGATPNHYGDAIGFETPNARIPFFVSTLFWQNHPRDARPSTPPEVSAPPTREAFLAGRDPALEAIEGWDPRPVVERLRDALESEGVDQAIEAFRSFRADARNRYVDVESDLNRLGYVLLRDGRVEDALRVFRLVVETHPESANAHDSFAEALEAAGEIDASIEQYERAVELDPDGFVGQHAREVLERIRAEREGT